MTILAASVLAAAGSRKPAACGCAVIGRSWENRAIRTGPKPIPRLPSQY
jgi:hypothetical protein